MTVTIKRGALLKVTMELTPEEWAAISPWETIRAEAQMGAVEHEMTVTADDANRTLLLTLNTQPLAFGAWKFDVRAEKPDGEIVFIPPSSILMFTVIEGVTE